MGQRQGINLRSIRLHGKWRAAKSVTSSATRSKDKPA